MKKRQKLSLISVLLIAFPWIALISMILKQSKANKGAQAKKEAQKKSSGPQSLSLGTGAPKKLPKLGGPETPSAPSRPSKSVFRPVPLPGSVSGPGGGKNTGILDGVQGLGALPGGSGSEDLIDIIENLMRSQGGTGGDLQGLG